MNKIFAINETSLRMYRMYTGIDICFALRFQYIIVIKDWPIKNTSKQQKVH